MNAARSIPATYVWIASAFSMISSRRRIGFSEGNGAVPVDFFLEAFFPNRFLDYVDPAAKNVGQAAFQRIQAADIVQTPLGEILSQTDNHIDIVSRILTARHRAEQRHANDTSRAEFPLVVLQDAYDLVAIHGSYFAIPPPGRIAIVSRTLRGGS